MLKRKPKLVMLLVLTAFIFSFAVPASAANFSDLNGNAVQNAAIYELNALGIIEGYPDGTFGPDKTISRAEFAKIAVNLGGLQQVAEGMASVASTFKDVSTGQWYNGFVNVAAAQGYVKGDPGGTFRPNDQVTQAEVITVFMRILGYNDNLAGDWPADYIAKAANLDLFDDITFVANRAATRAEVASLGCETLNQYVVQYQADSNTFINDTKVDSDDLDRDGKKNELVTYTLVEDKFKGGLIEDALVARIILPDSEDGEYQLEYYTLNDDDWEENDITLDKNFVVANGKSILDANMRFVDLVLNDDDEAIYISVNDYGIVKDDEIECKSFSSGLAKKIELNNKDYDFAENVIWNPSGDGHPYLQKQTGVQDSADWYTATLNDDGDVAAVTVSSQPAAGIVKYVNSDRETISFKSNPESSLTMLGDSYTNKANDLSDKSYYVSRDGMPASLEDIREDDAVLILSGQDNYQQSGYAGVDYYIQAYSPGKCQVKGNFDSVESNADGTLKKVTINDKEYEVVDSIDYSNYSSSLSAGVSPVDDGDDGLNAKIANDIAARIIVLKGQGLSQSEAEEQANDELALQPDKPVVSTDDGDDFEVIEDTDFITGDPYDLLGEKVTAVLTPNGKVGVIISDVDSADTGKIFGSIVTIVSNTTKGADLVDMIKIVNKDDQEVSYAITDDTTYNGQEIKSIYKQLYLGEMIALTVDGDGNIDNIKTTDIYTTTISAGDIDDDLNSLKINGSWYAAGNAKVFNYKPSDEDTDVFNWNDIEDTVNSGTSVTIKYYEDNNEIKYIAVNNIELTTESNYAVFVRSGTDSEDDYAVIISDGKEKKVYLTNNASYTEIRKYKEGNLLEFKWEGNDIKVVPKSTLLSKIVGGGYGEVTDIKVKSNIVEINKTAYLVDEDTLVYNSINHNNLEQLTLDDVARGDYVYAVFDKDNKALAAIVITDADDADDMGIDPIGRTGSDTVAVTGITLNSNTLALTAGGTAQTLTAVVSPSNASNSTVVWSSSNTGVASVSNGIVTPLAVGSAYITATSLDGSKTSGCTVTVTAAATVIQNIAINPAALSLTAGGTAQTLTAVVEPNISDAALIWSSDNTAVATVDKGTVVPIATGMTNITAKTIDGSKTAICAVTVNPATIAVKSVTLTAAALILNAGGSTGTLTTTIEPSNATNQAISWSSSDINVATVNNGIITPQAAGTATITASTADGAKTASCIVTVNAPAVVPVNSIVLNTPTLTLTAGGSTGRLTTTIQPGNATNQAVSWSSSDTTIATIDNGVVTPLSSGTAYILAKTVDGGKAAMCTVTVNPATVAVNSITLDTPALTLTAGGGASTLTAAISPDNATNKAVSWSSSDTAVAAVYNGIITPLAAGKATITAITADGAKTASCIATVNPAIIPVNSVTLNPANLSLTVGGAAGTLTAVIEPNNASNQAVNWTSSNPSIATVENGIVTPVSPGIVYIFAASVDGYKVAGCVVTVN